MTLAEAAKLARKALLRAEAERQRVRDQEAAFYLRLEDPPDSPLEAPSPSPA